jgi:hypothetical protein
MSMTAFGTPPSTPVTPTPSLLDCLISFTGPAGQSTEVETVAYGSRVIPRYTNDYWTARQRQAASIQEISYRACFKPQLPGFFIDRLTEPGDVVYDPFSGRGTTVIQAGLSARRVIANDANPLSKILTCPRFFPPSVEEVAERLETIPSGGARAEIDLSMFYALKTEQEIVALRDYLIERKATGRDDSIDRWIAMVATNRLTGHSPGFFSVYTLPPNQAVSQESQRRINTKRNQVPAYRDTRRIIIKKTKALLSTLTPQERAHLNQAGETARFFTGDARATPRIPDETVQLTVTSPPFLDIVQYRQDNWLRCWFNGLDGEAISRQITVAHGLREWESVMGAVFTELYRITAPGGSVAFEVGEVRNRTIRLEEYVVPLGCAAGFSCDGILINRQKFTKTSNIWGVDNMKAGTNTNRIVVFSKDGGTPCQ